MNNFGATSTKMTNLVSKHPSSDHLHRVFNVELIGQLGRQLENDFWGHLYYHLRIPIEAQIGGRLNAHLEERLAAHLNISTHD